MGRLLRGKKNLRPLGQQFFFPKQNKTKLFQGLREEKMGGIFICGEATSKNLVTSGLCLPFEYKAPLLSLGE